MLISMIEQCQQEVDALHLFFENWFNAKISDDNNSFSRFSDVLGDKFRIIPPSAKMSPKDQLLNGLKSAYGAWKDKEPPLKIFIKNFEGQMIGQGICLVTYEEWQGPSENDAQKRRSSALFKSKEGNPNGVEWLHVHETWIDG